MRHVYIFILALLTCTAINAQTVEISSKYELQIKDQKILDALSICFSNFDEYTKANQLNVFKIFVSCLSPDEIELKLEFYTPIDTIQYTQPDNYYLFKDKIAFIYFGKTILTKNNDPNFHNYILSICREKMSTKSSFTPKSSTSNETKNVIDQSIINRTKLLNETKVLPRGTKGLILERTFVFDPSTFIYSIRKIKDKVIITSLKGGEI